MEPFISLRNEKDFDAKNLGVSTNIVALIIVKISITHNI